MFRKDVERFRRCFGARCKLYVGMGSSETGMVLECFLAPDMECRTERLPLGFPAQGTDVLIVDEHGNDLGAGQSGEIAVSSRYLSPGYWRRPELTAAAFRTDPLDRARRLYLTGDLGFRLPNGCFFHTGRKDSQIKIRGARVEPAEVEAALLRLRDVREAIVLPITGRRGEVRLFAYVTPERGSALDTAAIREHARACLPEPMVPSLFRVLDDFPRLPSGKVDRQALPQHDAAAPLQEDYSETARLTMLETQLRAVWQDLLHADGVGVGDDFFELGGDSLLAANLIARVEELFDRRLRFEDFPNPLTIEVLSRILLERSGEIFQAPVVVLQPNGSKPPLFFSTVTSKPAASTAGISRDAWTATGRWLQFIRMGSTGAPFPTPSRRWRRILSPGSWPCAPADRICWAGTATAASSPSRWRARWRARAATSAPC